MKKRIIILASIILLLILGWTAAWYFIAGQARQQVEALALSDGQTTPQLRCETLDIGGYPFRFDIDCAGASIVAGDVLAEIPGLRASVLVYRPTHVLASALGPAEISDAFTGMRQQLAWTGLEASIRVEDWRIARASLVGADLVWADRLFGDTEIVRTPAVEMHLLDMPERHDAEAGRAGLALYATLSDLVAPAIQPAPIDAELEAELTGLPDDLRSIGAVPFLPDWQAAGGRLRLVGLRANDGTADLDASGELGLDERGYPVGAINIGSFGVAERLAPFIEDPWRTLVLGVPDAQGRHQNQLKLAAGGLSSGLVPITAVPSLF